MDDHKYYEEKPDERSSSSADDSPRFRYHPDSPGSQKAIHPTIMAMDMTMAMETAHMAVRP